MYSLSIFLPLISFFTFIVFSNLIKKKYLIYISIINIFLATLISFDIFNYVVKNNDPIEFYLFNWLNSGNFVSKWMISINFLTSIMILVVNIVSALVQFYSVSYMKEDKLIARFFCYLNLFSFFMLFLVS